jgi:hypothetical protein
MAVERPPQTEAVAAITETAAKPQITIFQLIGGWFDFKTSLHLFPKISLGVEKQMKFNNRFMN